MEPSDYYVLRGRYMDDYTHNVVNITNGGTADELEVQDETGVCALDGIRVEVQMPGGSCNNVEWNKSVLDGLEAIKLEERGINGNNNVVDESMVEGKVPVGGNSSMENLLEVQAPKVVGEEQVPSGFIVSSGRNLSVGYGLVGVKLEEQAPKSSSSSSGSSGWSNSVGIETEGERMVEQATGRDLEA